MGEEFLGHRMARLMPLLVVGSLCQYLKIQVKHVLAGIEYSGSAAAARREEKSLVFGDEVPEDKFTSYKPRGSDPRSLNDFTTEDIERLNNVSFSDPEYTNKVLLVVNLASFRGYTPQYYALNALTERYAD